MNSGISNNPGHVMMMTLRSRGEGRCPARSASDVSNSYAITNLHACLEYPLRVLDPRMTATRTPHSSSRSSPRSSVKSSKSTPKAKRPSSLRQSTTPASIKPKARPKTKAEAEAVKPTSKKTNGRNQSENKDPELVSATGLTETESQSSSSDTASQDAFDPPSSEEDEAVVEDEDQESELDSDFLDEEDDEYGGGKAKKRKSNGGGGGGSAKKVKPTVPVTNGKGMKSSNGRSTVKVEGYEDEDEDEDEDVELEEGQEIAGRIYPAPKTGQGGCNSLSIGDWSIDEDNDSVGWPNLA